MNEENRSFKHSIGHYLLNYAQRINIFIGLVLSLALPIAAAWLAPIDQPNVSAGIGLLLFTYLLAGLRVTTSIMKRNNSFRRYFFRDLLGFLLCIFLWPYLIPQWKLAASSK